MDLSGNIPLILSFIFGAIVGSFLNVVAIRMKSGSTLGGRSKCMSCGKTLTWLELVPIASFIAQKGACRKCKSKISWQYPLVEFVAGALFVIILFTYPPVTIEAGISTLIQILAACLLLVITVYDFKHKIIPDSLVFTFDGLALLNLFVGGTAYWHVPSIESLMAGPLLALPFALLWVISRGMWMGLGDAKLVLGIGWFLGVNAGINAVVMAFWIGAVISLIWLYVTYKNFKPKTEIPFGPYLILGMYLVMLFGIEVIDMELLRYVIGL